MTTPLLFIHGSGDNAHIWDPQLQYFSNAGKHAIAIDLPGHGQRPDTLPSTGVSVETYAEAVYHIFTHELHLIRPVIAGHSMGGAIALTLALNHESALAGLVLIGTGARLRVHPTLLEEAQRSSQEAKQHLIDLGTSRTDSPSPVPETDQAAIAQLYRDLSACNTFDVLTRLHEIQLPTLIICGEQDRLTPIKYSQYLQQHIVQANLSIIPDAGHYVQREQPEMLNRILTRWLQDHSLST